MVDRRLTVLFAAIVACTAASAAFANNSRVGIHGLYLEPSGHETRQTSREAWGVNGDVVLVPPGSWNAIAFAIGVDWMRLDDWTQTSIEKTTGLRVERQTNQDLVRIYAGARLGHQGHGFLRPYVFGNVGINVFSINTDVVIPDDSSNNNEIRQDAFNDTETAFGFDSGIGLELNFESRWYIDLGGKFIKTFGVPSQLGGDAEEIHPQYFQAYLGAGLTFSFLEESEE